MTWSITPSPEGDYFVHEFSPPTGIPCGPTTRIPTDNNCEDKKTVRIKNSVWILRAFSVSPNQPGCIACFCIAHSEHWTLKHPQRALYRPNTVLLQCTLGMLERPVLRAHQRIIKTQTDAHHGTINPYLGRPAGTPRYFCIRPVAVVRPCHIRPEGSGQRREI